MIIESHRLIFIHIPKNAGQSVEAAFGRKWVPPHARSPENAHLWPDSQSRHTPLRAFTKDLDLSIYRSFAIVRNPWDRMVSSYKYELKLAKAGLGSHRPNRKLLADGASFADYVAHSEKTTAFLRPQLDWIRLKDKPLGVTHLLRFESLEQDFTRMALEVGLPFSRLPHINKTAASAHYSAYYDEHTRRMVSELYARDIATFGYVFENVSSAEIPVEPTGEEKTDELTEPTEKRPLQRRTVRGRPDPLQEPGKSYRLPDFLIIGGMKCGTSSVGHNLNDHPGLFLANRGFEVHYFNAPDHYERGPDWYRAHFPETEGKLKYGDKTPAYIDPQHHERMHALLPDAKLIAVLRDPVSRFQSHYNYTQRKKVRERIRLAHARPFHIDHLHDPVFDQRILNRGFYCDQLENLFRFYPRNQVHVALLDDFQENEQAAYDALYDFIGVERVPVASKRYNQQESYPFPLDTEAKRALHLVYEPHNRRLFELLGREAPRWARHA